MTADVITLWFWGHKDPVIDAIEFESEDDYCSVNYTFCRIRHSTSIGGTDTPPSRRHLHPRPFHPGYLKYE